MIIHLTHYNVLKDSTVHALEYADHRVTVERNDGGHELTKELAVELLTKLVEKLKT